ncbi:hypothetical protein [Bradyrhizobium australafricanum]|uniref:hypothetical protein n=1 Tax=Bradyrhizobium australafricanum TaxID=2821406 RepID=UPI001CE2B8B7|nr:hypothetical protein [Bradyrhizobium australafricanum]MCA6097623.1 hypothetical protein [Bradyrhizobium australafricanum]
MSADDMAMKPSFVEKFIGFVDILGFKNMVLEAEKGHGLPLEVILSATNDLGSDEIRDRYRRRGPSICPQSAKIAPDVDFQITQLSDSVLVSTEISPAGVISLVEHCWQACFSLLAKGILCRGSIGRGPIFHSGNQFVGSGYQTAIEREKGVSIFKIDTKEASTPFIEVDGAVVRYVAEHGDACVKKMFERMVASDGNLTAIFPFKRLNQRFLINDQFDADKQIGSLNNIRSWIRELKTKIAPLIDQNNPSAVAKGAHYFRMLDAQLIECDKTEERIEAWRRALARGTKLTDPRVGIPGKVPRRPPSA